MGSCEGEPKRRDRDLLPLSFGSSVHPTHTPLAVSDIGPTSTPGGTAEVAGKHQQNRPIAMGLGTNFRLPIMFRSPPGGCIAADRRGAGVTDKPVGMSNHPEVSDAENSDLANATHFRLVRTVLFSPWKCLPPLRAHTKQSSLLAGPNSQHITVAPLLDLQTSGVKFEYLTCVS